jgi:hypothetical protein
MRVGAIVSNEDLREALVLRFTMSMPNITHKLSCGSCLTTADRLLPTNDEDRRRPPRRLANVPRLSRTREIALVQPSASGLIEGSVDFGAQNKPIFSNRTSKGLLGRSLTRAPSGIDTTPNAREIPHSLPLIGVTWKADPPTKTMRIWTPISVDM